MMSETLSSSHKDVALRNEVWNLMMDEMNGFVMVENCRYDRVA
jgi:hypothetical protein